MRQHVRYAETSGAYTRNIQAQNTIELVCDAAYVKNNKYITAGCCLPETRSEHVYMPGNKCDL